MQLSFFALFTAGLATLSSAYTHPRGDPQGNPIYTPSLDQIVRKGQPFDITWKPTSEGTVTLLLLRGPSTNVHVLHPIVEKIPNRGHYRWHPNMNLEVDKTHYGIQLIQDRNGHYQYSTQFGIGKPLKHHPGRDDAGLELAAAEHDTRSSADGVLDTEVMDSLTTYIAHPTEFVLNQKTYTVTSATTLTITDCPCTVTHTAPPSVYTTPPPPTTSPTQHIPPYPSTTHGGPSNGTTTKKGGSSSTTKKPVTLTKTTGSQTPKGPSTTSGGAPTTTSGAAVKMGLSAGAAGIVGVAAAVLGL